MVDKIKVCVIFSTDYNQGNDDMSKKSSFLNDWSNLTESQVSENIEYLLKNYRKYKITNPELYKIQIENVVIEIKEIRTAKGILYRHFVINGRAFPYDSSLGRKLSMLRMRCWEHINADTFKKKAQKWWTWNKPIILDTLCGFILLTVLISVSVLHANKDRMIKEKVNARKREFPNYIEYERALEAYQDSLNKNISMWPWGNRVR